MAHNSHPLKMNLMRRRIKLNTICPVCCRVDEDGGHLFFKCKEIRRCWLLLNLEEVRIILLSQASIHDMLEKIWGYEEATQQKIILLLWCWWSARNKVNAGERAKRAQEVVNDVLYYWQTWNRAHPQNMSKSNTSGKPKWSPPPVDYYKVNCDGVFLSEYNKGGWGFVIRDHEGQFVAAGAGSEEHLMSAEHSETIACLKGLELAASLGMQRIIVETDAAVVAKAMEDPGFDRSPLGAIFREIRARMVSSVCSISHCPRACNSVAHTVVASVPDFVAVLVSSDLPAQYV